MKNFITLPKCYSSVGQIKLTGLVHGTFLMNKLQYLFVPKLALQRSKEAQASSNAVATTLR